MPRHSLRQADPNPESPPGITNAITVAPNKETRRFTVNLNKVAACAAMSVALGFGAFGGAGLAQAKPHDPFPCVGPGGNCWAPGDPPGHNPWGPPGQVMQGNPVVPGLTGVPPGH